MGCIKSTCPMKIIKSSAFSTQKSISTIQATKSKHNKSNVSIKIKNLITKVESRMEDNYKILSKLGGGGFGYVYKVQNYKTQKIYAMKVVRKYNKRYQEDDQTFLKEIEILITLEHPNIIKIFEYYEDEINFYLITEYVPGGELFDFVARDTSFTEYKAKKIIKQILQALSYLHSKNLVHRDIKSENILLEFPNENNDDFNIKIIDFGTCNYISHNRNLTTKVGSPYYIAPEVLKGNYNMKCDIWSTGIILYIMEMGFPPFNGKDYNEMFQNIQNANLDITLPQWQKLSSVTQDLIIKMLNKDINTRPTAQECLNHPWFSDEGNKYKDKCSDESINTALNNIVAFNTKEKLQQATIAYIVHSLYYSEELNQLKSVFKELDVNNDGMLTLAELRNGFDLYFGKGMSEIKLQEIMDDIDGNNDGIISYEEFLRVAIKKEELIEEQHLRLSFERFDSDKDGKLSKEELKKVLYTSNLNYINVLLKEIDTNGDGYLNYEEFKFLMNSVLTDKQIIIHKSIVESGRNMNINEKYQEGNNDLNYNTLFSNMINESNEKFLQEPFIYKYFEIDNNTKYKSCKSCKSLKTVNNANITTTHDIITNNCLYENESSIFCNRNPENNLNNISVF